MTAPDLSRRRFFAVTGAAALVAAAGSAGMIAAPPAVAASQPEILPRAAWANGLAPVGPLGPEDVKFLLVHHSQDPNNTYTPDQVPQILRDFYAKHVGPEKKWPDVAYNFFVDRFGRIWEGRTGSLAGPVAGSATGGNQGYSQLCCFVGDHTAEAPSAAAQASMTALLAWLAGRYGVETSPGSTVSFISKGSNKYAKGAKVTVPTVAAHRLVSETDCPGNAAYALVAGPLPGLVHAAAGGGGATVAATSPAPAAPVATPPPAPTVATTAPTTEPPATEAAPTTAEPASSAAALAPNTTTTAAGDGVSGTELAIGAGVAATAAVAGAAAIIATTRKRRKTGDDFFTGGN